MDARPLYTCRAALIYLPQLGLLGCAVREDHVACMGCMLLLLLLLLLPLLLLLQLQICFQAWAYVEGQMANKKGCLAVAS